MRRLTEATLALALAGASFMQCRSCAAQSSTSGAITGRVTDPQGRVITNAIVTARQMVKNESESVHTNAEGRYLVPLLEVGSYQLEVNVPGFAPFVAQPIIVRVTEVSTFDITLRLGVAQERVEVKSEAGILQSTSSSLGGVVNSSTIEALPLATRNYLQLMVLSPGVVSNVPNATDLGLNGIELSAQGARLTDNSVTINGVDATDYYTNTLASYLGGQGVPVPAPDSLEEFKVQTALYDATSGRNGGANIAVVTKGGTNDLHGSAYDFFRNDALNANDFFFNRTGQPRPILRQNQFGATIGGPIRKDRTFYFLSYQGTRQTNGAATETKSSVILPPLPSDRSASSLGAVFGGQRGFQAYAPGGLGVAVAQDGSNINPVALALLNYKLPGGHYLIPGPQTSNGLSVFSIPGVFDEDQFNINLDQNLGPWGTLAAKYFYARQQTDLPFYTASLPGFPANAPARNHNLSISHSVALSPRWDNVFRMGFTRSIGNVFTSDPVSAAEVGMNTAPPVTQLPLISIGGSFSIGVGVPADSGITANLISLHNTLTHQWGRHLLRVGVEGEFLSSGYFIEESNHGNVVFLDFPSFLIGLGAGANGFIYSDIVINASLSGSYDRLDRATNWASFFQDDIQLTSRLTLNTGLRYDHFGGIHDTRGRNSLFDYSLALPDVPPGGTNSGHVVGPGYRGTVPGDVHVADSDSLRTNRNLRDFEPRVGFAFQPHAGKSNLVIRGGYGIYFSQRAGISVGENSDGYPFNSFVLNQFVPGSSASLQDPLPPIQTPSDFPFFVPRTSTSMEQFTTWNPRMSDAYMQHRSLGVQYKFALNSMIEADYVGTKGTHLAGTYETNEPVLADAAHPVHGITTNTVANAPLRVPFQGIAPTTTGYFDSVFGSEYDSLQLTARTKPIQGLDITSSYTFGRSFDDLTQTGNAGAGSTTGVFLSRAGASGDSHNIAQGWGLSDFNRTHRFVSSFVWSPEPYRHLSPLLSHVINGWGVAGLLMVQSGLPFSVLDSTAASIYAQNTSRAQFTQGYNAINAARSGAVEHRLDGYFKTEAFTTAAAIGDGTGFGNSGRSALRGPDQRNLDLAVMRELLRHGERIHLHLRAEAYNLTNTPNFSNPGSDRGTSSTFARISTTSINPRVLQFTLRITF